MSRPVRVVVVAYGAPDLLERCLESVGDAVEVTVVDNASSAAAREAAARHQAAYIDPGANLGFAAGVNRALPRILGDQPVDVLLLNPDVVMTPGAISTLSSYLHSEENFRVAALSPTLEGVDGRAQRVLWPFPTPMRAWLNAFGLSRVGEERNTFVVGAALLLRWEAINEVGLFDERFFLYGEETDWQRRARNLGWVSAVCDDVVVQHIGAATSSDERRRESLFHAAQEIYTRKWYGGWGWLVYRAASLVDAGLRIPLLKGDRRAESIRRASLYLRGPRRQAFPSRD
jgi:GT2 family glycosyltransferase